MTTQARELAGIISNAGDLNFSDDITLGSDASVLNFGADSEVTVTHVHNTGLLVNSTRQLQFGDSGTYINQSGDGVLNITSDTEVEINATTVDINANVDISGNLVLGGNITIGDADSDDISFGGELTSHIIPNADNTYDLGSSTKEWRNAYFDGTVTSDAFAGPLTGDVTGNVSGTAATVTTAAQTNITSLGTLTALTVDNIALDGNTMTTTSSDFILDASHDIILDADGGNIKVKDAGTTFFDIQKSSNDAQLISRVSDGDMVFRGNDDGSTINALTLDMSNAGKAAFNAGATFGNMVSVTTTGVDYKVIRAYDGTYNVSMGRDAIAAYNGDTEVDLYVGRGAQDVIISSGSKLGIGDTSPRSTLHVVGNITINASSNAPYIDFVEHGATDDPKARIAMDQISGTDGQLIFYTEDSGTLAEKLRIADAGQIGIGGANYGTDGQLLTSTGASTAPAWEDAPSSGISTGKAIAMAMVFG